MTEVHNIQKEINLMDMDLEEIKKLFPSAEIELEEVILIDIKKLKKLYQEADNKIEFLQDNKRKIEISIVDLKYQKKKNKPLPKGMTYVNLIDYSKLTLEYVKSWIKNEKFSQNYLPAISDIEERESCNADYIYLKGKNLISIRTGKKGISLYQFYCGLYEYYIDKGKNVDSMIELIKVAKIFDKDIITNSLRTYLFDIQKQRSNKKYTSPNKEDKNITNHIVSFLKTTLEANI